MSVNWTNRKEKFFPEPFVDDSASSFSKSSHSSQPRPEPIIPDNANWKDEQYYRLPKNVKNAIDVAEMKSRPNHSKFYHKLQNLNNKIDVYRSAFYSRQPEYERIFLEKNRARLEEVGSNRSQKKLLSKSQGSTTRIQNQRNDLF